MPAVADAIAMPISEGLETDWPEELPPRLRASENSDEIDAAPVIHGKLAASDGCCEGWRSEFGGILRYDSGGGLVGDVDI